MKQKPRFLSKKYREIYRKTFMGKKYSVPTKKKCEKEADKRYGGMSFGNDCVTFLEGALWASGNENK